MVPKYRDQMEVNEALANLPEDGPLEMDDEVLGDVVVVDGVIFFIFYFFYQNSTVRIK